MEDIMIMMLSEKLINIFMQVISRTLVSKVVLHHENNDFPHSYTANNDRRTSSISNYITGHIYLPEDP